MDADKLEKYSSAATLSDMEIFIFPELLYGLVLANIMSPRIWTWRDDPWFAKIGKMSPYRRVLRLKQYIIDHYEFNLDLDTWGLTTQEKELARFSPWIDKETLSESNALFGYEGDRHYFSMDIRRHFGLDKYTDSIIPYWKTETVEAMDAFHLKEDYQRGAGECVSLSTLYAAALFIVCRIPLEDIYLMATPLHSQNYILVNDGVITNNRRIVTKKMWFNGTELTAKAQRALRNEQVTIVANNTGYIHVHYPEATIAPTTYHRFRDHLKAYLTTHVDAEILANFLRHHHDLQPCFQLEHHYHGAKRYIPLEKVYHYEHSSPFKIHANTRGKLLAEIDEYEFFSEPLEGRIQLTQLEEFFREHRINFDDQDGMERLVSEFSCEHGRAAEILEDLRAFIYIHPRLPGEDKQFRDGGSIVLSPEMSRDDIIAHLESIRATNPCADLAFYAARDMSRTEWRPFIKAATERNPVCIKAVRNLDDATVIETIRRLPNESIYDESRIAQPDEVWNFGRGDGIERAVCLMTILGERHPETKFHLISENGAATLRYGDAEVSLATHKGLAMALTHPNQ